MKDRARILIVEDDMMVRDVITLLLEDRYALVGAGSVRDALAALVLSKIDLILLDCILPDGSYETITSYADRAGLPVLIMTGHPSHMAALQGGVRPFMLKPFGPDELRDRVDHLMALADRGAGPQITARAPSASTPEQIAASSRISPRTAELVLRARECYRDTAFLMECRATILTQRSAPWSVPGSVQGRAARRGSARPM